MAISDELLTGLAAQAFNMARQDIKRGKFNFLLAGYHEGEPLRRMKRAEALIIERLGENWLANGEAKDIGFGILRLGIRLLPPDAVIIATEANLFRPTPKVLALPWEEQEKLRNATSDDHHQAVRDGLLEVGDALHVTVQTPERVCFYIQEFGPGGPKGRPESFCFDQSEFDGRLKLFGEGENTAPFPHLRSPMEGDPQ